jgi:hypothetical protein
MKVYALAFLGILLIFLVALGLLSGCGTLRGAASKAVRAMEAEQAPSAAQTRPIAGKDLEALPPIVRRYLAYSGIVGKVPVRRVRIKQKGRMKTDPKAEWRDFTSEEYFTVNPKSFVWLGTFPIIGPVSIQAIDRFGDAHGSLRVRLSPFFDIALAEGKESDVSEFIRFFNEMTWFPSALLDPRIAWEDLGDRKARATLRDQGLEASAVLSFGEKGELLSWATDDRYALVGGKQVKARWTTIGDPDDILEAGGYRIPRGGSAIYSLPEGEFRYIDIYIAEIEYDPTELLYD